MSYPPYGHQTPQQPTGGAYNANINPYNAAPQNPQAPFPYPGAPMTRQTPPQHYSNPQAQGFGQPGGTQHAPPHPQHPQYAQRYQQPQGTVARGAPALPNQPYQPAPYMQAQPQPLHQPIYSTSRSVPSSDATQPQIPNPPHTSPPNSGIYGQPPQQQYQQAMTYRDQQLYPVQHPQQHFSPSNSMGSYSIPDMSVPSRPPMSLDPGTPYNMSMVTNDRVLDAAARKAFDEADRDKSGYLDFKEFLDTLRTLEVNIAYHHALDRFAKMDLDKDGRIRLSEFVNGYLSDQFTNKDHQSSVQQQSTPMPLPGHWEQYPSATPSQQSQQTQQSHFQQQPRFPPQPR